MPNWPDKDPNENLDYTIDWSAALVDGDEIVSSEWVVHEELVKSKESFDSTKTIVWFGGGVLGNKYSIINKVTTTEGRIMERSILLKVKNR